MPSNEYTDDHVCEHDNDRVVIAPTVRSSPCIAPAYPAHFSYCSLQLPPPPNPIVMQTPALSTKGACVRCSPTPTTTHLSAPTPGQALSPSVADVLHLLDDGLSGTRQKFTHLSCSHGGEAGLTPLRCSGANSHVPLLAAGPPPSSFALQFVPSFKASHASVVLMP